MSNYLIYLANVNGVSLLRIVFFYACSNWLFLMQRNVIAFFMLSLNSATSKKASEV